MPGGFEDSLASDGSAQRYAMVETGRFSIRFRVDESYSYRMPLELHVKRLLNLASGKLYWDVRSIHKPGTSEDPHFFQRFGPSPLDVGGPIFILDPGTMFITKIHLKREDERYNPRILVRTNQYNNGIDVKAVLKSEFDMSKEDDKNELIELLNTYGMPISVRPTASPRSIHTNSAEDLSNYRNLFRGVLDGQTQGVQNGGWGKHPSYW